MKTASSIADAWHSYSNFYTNEANADRVAHMPGYSGPALSLFSGYITVSHTRQRQLFFTHVESSMSMPKAQETPLILWLNGGPGCSSLGGGFLTELGPFFPANRGETLVPNPHSWHKFGHLVFLESPAFVGFSYSRDEEDLTVGDDRTSVDNLAFLLGFLDRYPHLKGSPLWLSGESYAGHYLPQLALEIIRHNAKNDDPIRLVGMTLGNPWTEPPLDNKGTVEHWYTHSMISDEARQGIERYCNFSASNPLDPHPSHDIPSTDSQRCDEFCRQADDEIGPVDIYNVVGDDCRGDWRSMGEGWSLRLHRTLLRSSNPTARQDPPYDPCVENNAEDYLNRADVQFSLHANQSNNRVMGPWLFCTSESRSQRLKYNLDDLQRPMLPVYEDIRSLAPDLRILIYSGDQDASVPTLGTRLWLSALELRIASNATRAGTLGSRSAALDKGNCKWRSWSSSSGQVGGWLQALPRALNGLFATVRGAGHMAPYSQPERASFLVSRFIRNEEIP